jgi:hypothetical protein
MDYSFERFRLLIKWYQVAVEVYDEKTGAVVAAHENVQRSSFDESLRAMVGEHFEWFDMLSKSRRMLCEFYYSNMGNFLNAGFIRGIPEMGSVAGPRNVNEQEGRLAESLVEFYEEETKEKNHE